MTNGSSFDDLLAAAKAGGKEALKAAVADLTSDKKTQLLMEMITHQWLLIEDANSLAHELSDGDVQFVYRIVELLLSGPTRADATIIEQWRYVDEAAADRKLDKLSGEGRTVAKQIGYLRWLSEDDADAMGRAIEGQISGRKVVDAVVESIGETSKESR